MLQYHPCDICKTLKRKSLVFVQGVSRDETHEHVRALLKGLKGREGLAYDRHFQT